MQKCNQCYNLQVMGDAVILKGRIKIFFWMLYNPPSVLLNMACQRQLLKFWIFFLFFVSAFLYIWGGGCKKFVLSLAFQTKNKQTNPKCHLVRPINKDNNTMLKWPLINLRFFFFFSYTRKTWRKNLKNTFHNVHLFCLTQWVNILNQ